MINPQVLETVEEWNKMPVLYISFENVPEELIFVINRSAAKLGFLPVNLPVEDTEKYTTKDATTSVIVEASSTIQHVENSTDDSITSTVLRVYCAEDYLTIYCYGRDHSISSQSINVENIEKAVESILESSGIASGITLNEHTALKTIVFNPSTNSLMISSDFGVPILFLNKKLAFVNAYMSLNGSMYEKDGANAPIQLSKIPFGTFGNYVITNYEVTNTLTNKVVYNQSPIICIWDKYVLYADGNLSDTSLTWKFKVSNAPLDYIIDNDRLYLLDVTNGFYVINLKTRKILYSEQLEGVISFSVQQWQIIINTSSGNYKVIVDSAQKVLLEKQQVKEESPNSYVSIVDNKLIYPSITKIYKNIFGFFSSGIFLGERIVHLFVRDSKIYVVTEVGTWIMELSD